MPKKSKKSDKDPKISYYEAALNYKISLKEDELEEANNELKEYETKVLSFQQRNARLRETRESMMQRALQDYKVFSHKFDEEDKVEKEDVIKEWQNLWIFQKQQEDQIASIKAQLKQIESEISKNKKEIRSFSEYKSKGKDEFEIQINSLKQQMEAIHSNYEVMKSHLITDLENTRAQINKTTESLLAKQHKTSAEKVFKEMDKHTIQMMHDNRWMEEKIKVYIEESKAFEQENTNLEMGNLELMNKLFDYNTSDFKFSKAAFQTQFLDHENLQTNTILDIDLEKFETIRSKTPDEKPKIDFIDKVDTPSVINSQATFSVMTYQTDELKDQYEFKTPMYTSRGSYEIKALGLQGLRKPIYLPNTVKELADNEFKTEEWPVTQDMLQSKM